MASSVLIEEQIEIPLSIHSLADFRRWATFDQFPELGRIDYVEGRIEVDMSPEDLFGHGSPKTEMVIVVGQHVKRQDLGHLFIDSTRVSSPQGDVSAEPDIVFVSHNAIDSGQIRLVPKASGEGVRYVELEGGLDLVVEIISDSSVTKDTRRLPVAYFSAGVCELWLVDARGKNLLFNIHHRGPSGFEAAEPDGQGFQHSPVLGRHNRLDRHRDTRGHWSYDLKDKPS